MFPRSFLALLTRVFGIWSQPPPAYMRSLYCSPLPALPYGTRPAWQPEGPHANVSRATSRLCAKPSRGFPPHPESRPGSSLRPAVPPSSVPLAYSAAAALTSLPTPTSQACSCLRTLARAVPPHGVAFPQGETARSFVTSFRCCLKCHPGRVLLTVRPRGHLLDKEGERKSRRRWWRGASGAEIKPPGLASSGERGVPR